jgi:hypothetical protein
MTPELLQDAVVTVAALGAVSLIVRRVVVLGRQKTQGTCASCPSSRGTCAPTAPTASQPVVQPVKLHLLRKRA